MGKWKPSPPKDKHNYGHFTMTTPDERALLHQLAEMASSNPVKPGHGYVRLEAVGEAPGKPKRTGHLIYHLDANRRVLEVSESWDGIETAKRTQRLDEGGEN